MIYEVELMNFGKGVIRPVEVEECKSCGIDVVLETIYILGQNTSETQYLELPSVSKGDIIHINGERYLVKGVGFERLSTETYELLKNCLKSSIENGVRYSETLWNTIGRQSLSYC
jgi:hypothetical protein